jgi:hypothetical protein
VPVPARKCVRAYVPTCVCVERARALRGCQTTHRITDCLLCVGLYLAQITRDSSARYLAYLARAKAVFVSSVSGLKANAIQNVRYMAYSSDIGEGLRPVLPAWTVKAAYGARPTFGPCV